MLLEIVLHVEHRMSGRVPVGDSEIVNVFENGVKRVPRAASFNAAVDHIMEKTDLQFVESKRMSGRLTDMHQIFKYVYRKPGVYIQSQHNKWACAYEKDGFWWVRRLNRQTDTCFRTKSEAKTDVDSWVGYDYLDDLHKKTVVKDHQTQRAKSDWVLSGLEKVFGPSDQTKERSGNDN